MKENVLKMVAAGILTPEQGEQVRKHGPTRVIVDRRGYATTPALALRDYGVVADVVFVRKDGWTLGAPRRWQGIAEALWQGSWVAVIALDD